MRKQFFSRRNRVCLTEGRTGPVVEKLFPSAGSAAREAAVYRLLSQSGIKAAALLGQEENLLRLSFLKGEDYLTLLEHQEREGFSPAPWERLLEWLASFHRATGLVQRDLNLRNFLWHDGAAAGLDFEDCEAGNALGMATSLAAYVLLYDPPDTETKRRIAACIQSRAIELFSCSEGEFAEGLAREREAICRRRRRRG